MTFSNRNVSSFSSRFRLNTTLRTDRVTENDVQKDQIPLPQESR